MLQGPKISLRTIRAEDLDEMFAGYGNLENRGPYYPRWLESEPRFRKEFEENGFWEERSGVLAIVEPDGTLVGEIAFFPVHEGTRGWTSYELAYLLYGPDLHGRGYMTEAVQLLVEHLFDTKPILRLQLTIHPENEASKAVARKCGFTFEGVARGAFFMGGGAQDMEVWSILPSDPRPTPDGERSHPPGSDPGIPT